MPGGLKVVYQRDGTSEREFTKVSLPKPTVVNGQGERKQTSTSIEACVEKTCKDVNENGLMQ